MNNKVVAFFNDMPKERAGIHRLLHEDDDRMPYYNDHDEWEMFEKGGLYVQLPGFVSSQEQFPQVHIQVNDRIIHFWFSGNDNPNRVWGWNDCALSTVTDYRIEDDGSLKLFVKKEDSIGVNKWMKRMFKKGSWEIQKQ